MCNVFVACLLTPNIMTPCLDGGFKDIFLMFTPYIWGRWTHFDEHIFSDWVGSTTNHSWPACCCMRFLFVSRKPQRKTQPFLTALQPWISWNLVAQPWVSGQRRSSYSWQIWVVGFLKGGCSRGGGNWGTLGIPREDCGNLGNITED